MPRKSGNRIHASKRDNDNTNPIIGENITIAATHNYVRRSGQNGKKIQEATVFMDGARTFWFSKG